MLVFSEQNLAFIAVPKTGTTAIEMALRPKADIIFGKQRKHLTAQRFHRKIAPFLSNVMGVDPERFAVMRHPEEQIRSWYRYRTRDGQDGRNSALGMSFDAFVLDVIRDTPPPHAAIGSQLRMLTGARGQVLVHHLFAYEAQPKLRAFLDDRFGTEIVLKSKNVSPDVDAPLSPDIREQLRAARAPEFALYDRIAKAGGYLASMSAATAE